METVRQGTIAKTTHDPNIAYNVTRTAQASVNHVNNVATGRSPNAYAPYDINGNATSYYNSSRQEGKTPSPDVPRVEDVSGDVQFCNAENEKGTIVIVTDRETLHKYNLYMGTAILLGNL